VDLVASVLGFVPVGKNLFSRFGTCSNIRSIEITLSCPSPCKTTLAVIGPTGALRGPATSGRAAGGGKLICCDHLTAAEF
jgi:hypothetical protein